MPRHEIPGWLLTNSLAVVDQEVFLVDHQVFLMHQQSLLRFLRVRHFLPHSLLVVGLFLIFLCCLFYPVEGLLVLTVLFLELAGLFLQGVDLI